MDDNVNCYADQPLYDQADRVPLSFLAAMGPLHGCLPDNRFFISWSSAHLAVHVTFIGGYRCFRIYLY